MEEEEKKQEGFLKSVDLKKTIKAITIVIGFALIVFMSFFSAKFDFGKMDWGEWGAERRGRSNGEGGRVVLRHYRRGVL